MTRNLLLPLALLLVATLACVAWWSMSGAQEVSAQLIEVAPQQPIAAETVELDEPPRPTDDDSPRVVVLPPKPVAPRPAPLQFDTGLTIALQHRDGRPFFDTLDAHELSTAEALRLVLLEDCPRVGMDLPSPSRLLMHRSSNIRSSHSDRWMQSALKTPSNGCACVVLGDKVLSAAPFVADQKRVVMTVDARDLRLPKCTLEVLVVDDQHLRPLADINLVLYGQQAQRRAKTDASGRVTWEGLLHGDGTVSISHPSYQRVSLPVSLSSSKSYVLQTVELSRKAVIAGTLRWNTPDTPSAVVALISLGAGTETRRTVAREPRGWTGRFRFDELKSGDYLVGLAGGTSNPDPERVKNREVPGWTFVSTRYADVEDLWIDVMAATR